MKFGKKVHNIIDSICNIDLCEFRIFDICGQDANESVRLHNPRRRGSPQKISDS